MTNAMARASQLGAGWISRELTLPFFVELTNGELSMTVAKADKSVSRVVVEQATLPIEHAWLADMFMRNDRVQLRALSADVAEYVESLNIAQG